MSTVLAIDQGTTGSTALVFSQEGEILGRAYSEFPQHYPQPGWVEHDPEEIWRGSREVMARALDSSDIRQGEPAAVGITHQGETKGKWTAKNR